MKKYLIIENDKVINVIIADDLETASLVSAGREAIESIEATPWIDWTRSGDTWNPPAEEPTE